MEVILFLILVTQSGYPVICKKTSFEPSFVSKWHKMASQSDTLSKINISHDLNETPMKVIADIKVKDKEEEYIFRGMGGAETDDDGHGSYGGVLVLYDKYKVMLIAPKTSKGGEKIGNVIYTGSNTAWDGPSIARKYDAAMVRVRLWKLSDFPDSSFISNWTYIDVTKGKNLYNETQHPLGSYPDLVNVQVKVEIKDEFFIFEEQGSKSVLKSNSQHDETSGAVFGYNDKSFRIWFLNNPKNRYLFTAFDGWGDSWITATEGYYRVLAWKFPKQYASYNYAEIPKNYQMTIDEIKLDNMIVNPQIQVNEGQQSGYRFYGVGSTMHDGGVYGNYGGLIYAITSSSVLMWIPKQGASNGRIFNIKTDERTNNVLFRIELIWLTETKCSKEDLNISTSTTVLNVTGYKYMDKATYNCSIHHRLLGGDDYVFCQRNSTWSELTLRCHRCRCPCSNESDETLRHLMSKTKQQLTVDKKTLSNFIRKKTSAKDDRPVARGMGMVAGILLVVFLLCIIIPDVPLLYRQFKGELKSTKYRLKQKHTTKQKIVKHLKDAESLQTESVL